MSKKFKYLWWVFPVLLNWAVWLGRPEVHAQEEIVTLLDVGSATVGQPAKIRWSLMKRGTEEPVAARLSLTITHLEKGKTVFSLGGIPTEGDFAFLFHFTDGSQHRVVAVADVDGRQPIREEKNVLVTAVDPPKGSVLPALLLFLSAIAAGLLAGRASKRAAVSAKGGSAFG